MALPSHVPLTAIPVEALQQVDLVVNVHPTEVPAEIDGKLPMLFVPEKGRYLAVFRVPLQPARPGSTRALVDRAGIRAEHVRIGPTKDVDPALVRLGRS
ncbi:MAG: hypothetical protein HY815_16290 [Candidatus Riflebacteria bacterium]|nr:hypothetical protein [Candidatus Riflebacteria bacterium]